MLTWKPISAVSPIMPSKRCEEGLEGVFKKPLAALLEEVASKHLS